MCKKLYIRSLVFSLLMGSGSIALAQAEATGITESDILNAIIFTMIVMSIVALLLTFTIMSLVRVRTVQMAQEDATEAVAEGQAAEAAATKGTPWSWAWLQQKLTDAVPVAKEVDIDLGHDYDGIRELDNNLPPWWKYGFYFTIVWAVVYLAVFHVFGDWSSDQEYKEEMAVAEVEAAQYLKTAGNQVDESNVTLLTDEVALAEGKTIYEANCAPCHGLQGEGGIGPTFADNYWLHGGDIASVFKIVKYGVAEKGMIAWQDQMRPQQIQQVSSYLKTFVGTNPPNQKEPQGDLYEDGDEEEDKDEDGVDASASVETDPQAISMN